MASIIYKGGSGSGGGDSLPSQSGNSGKILGTISESLVWVPPVNISGVFTTDSLFTWQQKTDNFTAQNGFGYFVNSLDDILVTMPPSPSIGHTFQVINLAGGVGFDGKIDGDLPPGDDFYRGTTTTGKVIRFYYLDSTYGWFCDSDLPNNLYMGDGDPFFNNVVLFLKGDGTNNSTSIVDSSATPKTITRFGDTKISTAQSKYGGSSIYFDGAGDYLSLSQSGDFDFGTGDFTIEAFLNIPSLVFENGFYRRVIISNYLGGSSGFTVQVTGTNTSTMSNIVMGFGDPVLLSAPTANLLGSWFHFAFCRTDTTLKCFIDGVQAGSASNSTNFVTANSLFIGRLNTSLTFWQCLGYIDSLRITKGITRYTASFDPETDTFLA